MPESSSRYVPAAGRSLLTGLYDPVVALTMREGEFRPALMAAVLAERPHRVLDVGCGTGTLAAMLAASDSELEVLGVDGDESILERARTRTKSFSGRVALLHGLADALPIQSSSVDTVTASLLLHHLDPATKQRALAEFLRVLRPGGRLVIADWGAPHDPLMRGAFLLLQALDGFANTRQHAAGQLPSLIAQAGFEGVEVTRRWRTVWGSLELLLAEAPAQEA